MTTLYTAFSRLTGLQVGEGVVSSSAEEAIAYIAKKECVCEKSLGFVEIEEVLELDEIFEEKTPVHTYPDGFVEMVMEVIE